MDLKTGEKEDAESKVVSLMAEIQTPLHLKQLGYSEFQVLLPSTAATCDFEAVFQNQTANIEVKSLREPDDILRTVAADHWRKLRDKDPARYNFRVIVRHQHRGSLSATARKRLRSILDQLPKTKKPIEEVLDGNVRVSVERLPDSPAATASTGDVILSNLMEKGKEGQMIIQSGITKEHLTVDIAEIQSLFVKAIKPVVASIPKCFGESFVPDRVNVVAMRWEPPDMITSPEMMNYVEQQIENLFSQFELQLKPVIFTDPEIPWDLIRKYS